MITKKQIALWNEQFKSLSKPEQRVLIAQDVLKNIKLKKYIPRTGSYINVLNLPYDVEREDNVQVHFNKIQDCKVCAMGGCLLSLIKFNNNVTFGNIYGVNGYSDVWRNLAKYFTSYQLYLIEQAFEGDNPGCRVGRNSFNVELQESDKIKCNSFYVKYHDDEKRLKAIMENLIINKGTFKP